MEILFKKRLYIPHSLNSKRTKEQTIYKTLHRKLKIMQHKPY